MENTYDKMIAGVEEFHKAMGIDIGKPLTIPFRKNQVLLHKLLLEEVAEFADACDKNDIVEILDALADIQFVLLSAVVEHGMQGIFGEVFGEVCKSNMSKITPDGNIVRREDGKVITRGIGYKRPDIKTLLDKYNLNTSDK